MEDYKCRACGKIAAEGFALGRLCYYCIEEVVIYMKKQIEDKENSCKHGDNQTIEIQGTDESITVCHECGEEV
ncbi:MULTISPECIES: hypothetical protein [Bacillus]|jgi:hypothetical protein|uniref:Uncharacterized protein n=1 Tax=Bacillus cereus HuB4-4 TaxID=1053211 RepID=A0A9W5VIA3_BACCE|nr:MULTISPECIES: hypothetical protein [Bacillus]MBQ6349426.1 hypothetical protein [Methanobrevibacter sp.]MBQ9659028.1 hypothetical protein [Clostridia bacterium]EEK91802.1 hypothetical protein bcere0012_52680 [Bacillus cereus BDRD-ST24]EOP79207.1 hypothetical protein IGM_06417 [Bacillus cereus HuB4-4]KXH87640.1 hypothetical protein AU379_27330 [Bacillus sp. JH7]